MYSKIYLKKNIKCVINRGIWRKKIDFISILRFIYSRSIGVILEKTKLSSITKIFDRPLVAGGSSSKLSRKYYPEKFGDFVVKFPWSMDLNLREFPKKTGKIILIFFTHGIYDSKL